MAQRIPLRVQLLSVPDCPLVESARSTLNTSLAQTRVDVVVEELVGDYSSPTILMTDLVLCARLLYGAALMIHRSSFPRRGPP
ncbi:hypothetical protein V490_00127 [Pseudogymnoascus sp. VKM F-3557]|nr:hypothetical protein V490_00127 [Pseudogymnoascus sp. VKM F-3557]